MKEKLKDIAKDFWWVIPLIIISIIKPVFAAAFIVGILVSRLFR